MSVIQPIETRFDGHLFRSRTEARWAVFFKECGIRFEYEKEGYALPSGWYLPDFFLPDMGVWFEVKGTEPAEREIKLILEIHEATGFRSMLAVGAPEPRDQIIYPGHYDLPGDGLNDIIYERYYLCDDRRNDNEFWIVSDSCMIASSLGPVNGPAHGKYPSVHSATAKGYAAARSARFGR